MLDSIPTNYLLSAIGVLLILSAFFSSSETALMALNRLKLKNDAKTKKGAYLAQKLLQQPDRLIGLILIGNNFINIAATALTTVVAIKIAGDKGVAYGTAFLTFAILIFSEVTPKTYAALHPEKIAYFAAFILTPLLKILYPLVWITNLFTNGLLRLIGVPQSIAKEALSHEELRTLVVENNIIDPNEHQNMMINVMNLDHISLEDVMVPRNEITGIDINDDWKSIVRQLTHSPHGRIVLYRDQIDEVVGMLRLREAYRLMLEKNEFNKETLLRAADEIYFIPEATPLNIQLLKFQRNKQRIGLIVDEYGDINGLVTLEDILEEIVGEFTTSIAPSLSEEITPQSDGSFLIEGSANIRDINKGLQWTLPTNGPRTLNGLILEHLEDIPESHLSVQVASHPMEIVELEENRIKLVRVFPQIVNG